MRRFYERWADWLETNGPVIECVLLVSIMFGTVIFFRSIDELLSSDDTQHLPAQHGHGGSDE